MPAVRGRGAGLNPGNRFESLRLHVLGDELDDRLLEHPRGVQLPTMVFHDRSQRVINRVDSPDLGFNWTLNPYRGCEHGCVYCYARPTHETLGFSCGLDFETKIVVKQEAPELLRRELASPRWSGEPIVMSGVTDCYQPIEAKLQITRRCLAVMAQCCQPVGIVTKSRLVVRDLDHLKRLAEAEAVYVGISLTTLDAHLSAVMEPRASCPADRLRAMRELSDAGIPVAAILAPIIPGLNDREIPRLLESAAQAGATCATWVMLRLPYQVKALFLEWLQRHFPERRARIISQVRSMHGGELYRSTFGTRMRGTGPLAEQIAATFRVFADRCGLHRRLPQLSSASFRKPNLTGQMELFTA
ncbi:MAG: PA0069 family radical SAM protein [Planctomycetes bacterium]|nr:PA0069 family radical SAM protein [Planctomycetota bacterium]